MRYCRPWFKGALIAGMFLLGILAVAGIMPANRLLLGRRANRLNEAIVLNWNRAVCRILNLHLHVRGKADPEARLLVANHISWLDIIAVGSQRPCRFVAKEEVAHWPVMGYLAKGTDTLFVRRGDAQQTAATAELMVWRLRQGRRLMVFPEGTTTRGERVLRFHGRLFQPAQLAGVGVQAMALRYGGEARQAAPFIGDDGFVPHLFRILKLERIDLYLTYCPPLPAGPDGKTLAGAARRQVAEIISPSVDFRQADAG